MPKVFVGEEKQNINWQKTLCIMPGDTLIATEEQKRESFANFGKLKLMPPAGNRAFLTANLFLV